ncbi:hypothetical protein FACS1894208_12180 [Clostridia bacterium]|nr:hypothetical protein FACS1894208_12180 [Clostridia bacterium]
MAERMKLKRESDGVIRDLETGLEFPDGAFVSMNFWGFPAGIIGELKSQLADFLKTADLEKREFLLPAAVDELARSGKATVEVLPTSARWSGVTYREDRDPLALTLEKLRKQGAYPEKFWE